MAKDNTSFRKIFHGVTVEWNIKEFSTTSADNRQSIRSPCFEEANAEWQLLFYPNGETEEEIENISLFLKKKSANEDEFLVSILFLIKVKNLVVQRSECEHNFKDIAVGYGFRKFIDRSKILKYLKSSGDDCLTVICSVRRLQNLKSEILPNKIFFRDDCVKILSDNLKDIFTSQKFSDVTIKVDSERYPTHKAILAARSPVFSSMFEYEMAENVSGVVDISDCDPESFKIFLKFLYTGNLENTSVEHVISLYELANKYWVPELKDKCYTLLSLDLELETVLDVIDLATTHEETELLQIATDFFIINATEILVTEKWENFIDKKPSIAKNILKEMAMRSAISLKPERVME